MEKLLSSFFLLYPLQGNVKIALKMVKEKLKDAVTAKEEAKDTEDYLKHLSDAHRMIESIFTELGKHPNQYP